MVVDFKVKEERTIMKFFKDAGKERVSGDSPKEISLAMALEEIDIHPTFDGNFIGFVNERDEAVQFVRHEENKWLIDVPIIENGKYTHSLQVEDSSTEKVKQIVKRYFHDNNWEAICNTLRASNDGLDMH